MQNKNRRSIRLKDFDYSTPGDYFITICTHGMECIFGEAINCEMVLNEVGRMVNKWLLKINSDFPGISLDMYQIMPNHIHAIITISCQDYVGEAPRGLPLTQTKNNSSGLPNGRAHGPAPTIPAIISWLKTMITNEYINNVKNQGWKPFNKYVFQRSYYVHIITSEKSYNEIYDYIISNPSKWEEDKNHPSQMLRMTGHPKNI
jgi:REP element-mobilizing transposase RayT